MRINDVLPQPAPAQPTDYAALNRMVRKHKGALTRAKKKGPRAVVVAVAAALSEFNDGMWPDNWPTWTVALDDALIELRFVDFDSSDPEDAAVLAAAREAELCR